MVQRAHSAARTNGGAGHRPVTLAACRLLEEEPDLAAAVAWPRRAEATDRCLAREAVVARNWKCRDPAAGGGLGLLVLDGLLARRVTIGRRASAELLGPGDLLSFAEPGQEDSATLPLRGVCTALIPSRLAVLDAEFVERELTRFPELAGPLAARSARRATALAANLAIVSETRVDARIHLLLWHLAGRWGRVGPGGVVLPLRLTHRLLADLVAARRPTVTHAISILVDRGLVRRTAEGWLLTAARPGDGADDIWVLHTSDGAEHANARTDR
jgi:CRP-like cAMP-binding protein